MITGILYLKSVTMNRKQIAFVDRFLLALLSCVFSLNCSRRGPTQQDLERAERVNLLAIGLAVDQFRMINKEYPKSIEAIKIHDLALSSNFREKDVWGTKIRLSLTATDFEIRSYGADKIPDTLDDIVIRTFDLDMSREK